MVVYRIDINSDLGEGFGVYNLTNDKELLKYVTSSNIACAFHGGDYNIMKRTVKIAKEFNVGISAHPGLPDLLGFGRREMQVTPYDVCRWV